MAATTGLSLTLNPMGKMFQNASSLKPLGLFKPKLPRNDHWKVLYKTEVFSSPDPKGHVSYSRHLASVAVVRPSYVVNFFKNLLL